MKKLKCLAIFLIVATLFGGVIGCKQETPIPQDTAPANVTELKATNKDASVLLTWTDATDKDIYGYEVTWKVTLESRAVVMEPNSLIVAPGSKGCYVTNLENGTEYTFTVKTVDTSLNKSAGVAATITPKAIVAPVSLVPSTTEKINQDVTVNVEINPEIAEKVEQILCGSGIKTSLKNLSKDITNEKNFSVGENSSNTVAIIYKDGTFDFYYIVITNIDKTAPAKVENVKTTYSKETGKITLCWENPTDEDFVGTKIVYGLEGSEATTTLTFDKETTETVLENIKTVTGGTYTAKITVKDDMGNTRTYTKEIIVTFPKFTSVSIPDASPSYAGKMLPVTIRGEYFDSALFNTNDILCTGANLQNITVISSTKITAEIVCPSTVGTSEVTVIYGESSATATLKVGYEVGDIILTDGTKVSVADVSTYTIDEANKPVGVVVWISDVNGATVIGLQKRSSLSWAPRDTTGFNNEFTSIICESSKINLGGEEVTLFQGDTEGIDNWEYICRIDPKGSADAATNYPIFNFANTYGKIAGLTGTDYETGWYVPSIAEVYSVYANKEIIQISLTAASGFNLGTSYYWSSSQSSSNSNYACRVSFSIGTVSCYIDKYVSSDVFVLQDLNAE